jgi:hypothetical protein
MLGSGRTVGLAAILSGIGLSCMGCLAITFFAVVATNRLGLLLLGVLITLVLPSPIIRFGIRRFQRGQKILRELDTIKKQKTLLIHISQQGHIPLNELTQRLNSDTEEVKYLVYDLVNKGLFHGFIDLENGMLYSKHAVLLQGATHCPNCGQAQHFTGKGVVPCEHCQVQVLL